jgi:ribonuclease Z
MAHLEAFDACPIGDGYEMEVNEFDWKDENGIC